MTEESKALEVQKQEVTTLEDTERTRECQCFIPRADIFVTEEDIFVVVDVPGVDESLINTPGKCIFLAPGYSTSTIISRATT